MFKRVMVLHLMVLVLAVSVACERTIMPTPSVPSCTENSLPCLSDGGPLTVYIGVYPHGGGWGTLATLEGSYGATDLAPVSYLDHATTSGPGETDIIYGYMDLPFDKNGVSWCDDDSLGNNRCDQSYVAYTNYLGNLVNFPDKMRALACHETGHAVGLLHGNWADPSMSNSDPDLHCMRTPSLSDYALGSLNTGWINNVY